MSWKGSQYLPLRSAANAWTATTAALRRHAVPAAHRFCGISRQAAGCRGKLHSDHHNFVLSTLTPLRGCTKATGIVLDGVETPLLDGDGGNPGATVLVDNTFDHQVYNDLTEDPEDRYVLIVETWHPALTLYERRAMSDLFALRDLFGFPRAQARALRRVRRGRGVVAGIRRGRPPRRLAASIVTLAPALGDSHR